MWYELLFLNPIAWVLWLILGGSLLSWVYWYCKTNFELKGSSKHLDKSIPQYTLIDIMFKEIRELDFNAIIHLH